MRRYATIGSATCLVLAGSFAYGCSGKSGDVARTASSDTASTPTGPNILQDPGFEQQTIARAFQPPWSVWTLDGTPLQAGTDLSGYAHSGVKSGFVYAPDATSRTWSAAAQTVNVSPHTTYQVSFWVKPSATLKEGYIGANDSSGNNLVSTEFDSSLGTSYVLVSATFDSGANTSVQVFAGIWAIPGQTVAVNIDDASLNGPDDAGAPDAGPDSDSDSGSDTGSSPTPEAGTDGGSAVRGQNCAAYTKASPVGSGQEWVVDGAKGNDGNPGTSAAPFQTVQKAANVAQAGDVVTINAGSYTGLVNVQNSGTPGAPIVFQADQCGQAVFSGNTGFYPAVAGSPTVNSGCQGNADGQHDITLSGLDFKDTHDSPSGGYSAVIYLNDDWRVTNVLIDGSDDIEINERGTGDIMEQSTFMHGGSHSLVGCGGNPIVRNVINANNVTSAAAAANCGDSCSVKFLYTRGMMIDNIESYGNDGPGWWFDTDNFNFTIQNSYFHDNGNGAGGIDDEISDGPGLIQNNVFENNADSSGNGGDIQIWESKNVTLANNVMNGGSQASIIFRTLTDRCEFTDPSDPSTCMTYYQVGSITSYGNKMKDWQGCAFLNVTGGTIPDPTSVNLMLDNDLFEPSNPSSYCLWDWSGAYGSLSALTAATGQEAHGTIGSF